MGDWISVNWSIELRFLIALAIGVLLGIEREFSQSKDEFGFFAGVRTTSLIALLGGVGAFFAKDMQMTWMMPLLMTAVIGLVVISYAMSAYRGKYGMTTEVAMVMVFVLGALCVWGFVSLAVALAIVTLLLLSSKQKIRHFTSHLQPQDIDAAIKFAIISAIVLPLLPNQNFGPPPLNVLNPYKIWLMVVLISAINFISYVLVKFVGQEQGISMTGILGGLVSSTATTLGFVQRSKQHPGSGSALALGILLAWLVMFVRVLLLVLMLNPALGKKMLISLGVMTTLNFVICLFLWWKNRNDHETAEVKAGENPFELSEALKFGFLFGVVTFVAKAAQVQFGDSGLYVASAIAGLMDVDAIVLSMTELNMSGSDMLHSSAMAIMIAIIANTLLKTSFVITSGSVTLRRHLLPYAALLVVVGCAMMAFL